MKPSVEVIEELLLARWTHDEHIVLVHLAGKFLFSERGELGEDVSEFFCRVWGLRLRDYTVKHGLHPNIDLIFQRTVGKRIAAEMASMSGHCVDRTSLGDYNEPINDTPAEALEMPCAFQTTGPGV